MTTETIALIVQILIALGSLAAIVPVYYKMRSERRKAQASATMEEATAAQKLTQSAMDMVEQCEAKIAAQDKVIESLRANMARIEKHLKYWQRGCALLIQQLVENNLVPVWDPNGGPDDTEE